MQIRQFCMRIGNRWRSSCAPIVAGGKNLSWVDEVKYLGLVIKSGKNFTINWQAARSSFYKSINGILGVLGSRSSIQVVLALVRASCFPILTCALSTVSLSSSETSHFSFVYNSIFIKLFHVKEVNTIEQCQYFSHFWPFQALNDFLRFSFLANHFSHHSPCQSDAFDYPDFIELTQIAAKYNFSMLDSKACLKFKVWKFLESSLCLS